MNMRDCVEFFWDEQTGLAHYTFENDQTGEQVTHTRPQPLDKPVATEELRASYFANLKFWLTTQPLHD
jgi:hypothetical protein